MCKIRSIILVYILITYYASLPLKIINLRVVQIRKKNKTTSKYFSYNFLLTNTC